MPKPGVVAIGFSNVSHGLVHMFMLLYPTVVLGLEAQFGLSYGELLSLSLGGFILFGLGALPAGWLADRWSESGTFTVMLVGMGFAGVYTSTAESTTEIAVGLSLIGLFASIYHPVGIAMIVRHAAKRGRSLGVNGVFGGVGLASGPFIAGALMDLGDWRAAFLYPGLFSIALGAVFWFASRASGLTLVREDVHPEPEVPGRQMVSAFVTLAITTMCAGLIFQCLTLAMPKVFSLRLDYFSEGSALGVGGFVSLVFLVAACFQIIGGLLADRYPLKWVYFGGYVCQIPVLALAATATDLPIVGLMILAVLLLNGSAPAESSLFARYSPARWRATAFGIKFVIALGVSAFGVPLVAKIFDSTGSFFWLYVVLAGLAAMVALVALALPSERRTGASPEPALATAD
jgi:MFS family permease